VLYLVIFRYISLIIKIDKIIAGYPAESGQANNNQQYNDNAGISMISFHSLYIVPL
jgi:hypothetical protein